MQYESLVVSCAPCKFETASGGKKEKVDGYEIILEDTVFFPEGGGQVKLNRYL